MILFGVGNTGCDTWDVFSGYSDSISEVLEYAWASADCGGFSATTDLFCNTF